VEDSLVVTDDRSPMVVGRVIPAQGATVVSRPTPTRIVLKKYKPKQELPVTLPEGHPLHRSRDYVEPTPEEVLHMDDEEKEDMRRHLGLPRRAHGGWEIPRVKPASKPGEVPGAIHDAFEGHPKSDPPLSNLEITAMAEKSGEDSAKEQNPFAGVAAMPRLELRRVLLDVRGGDAWAVTSEIMLRQAEAGTYSAQFSVIEIFHGEENECKARAEAFMEGYLKGLKRVLG
jgi:hypothetical protein